MGLVRFLASCMQCLTRVSDMALSFGLELYKELRGHKGDVNYCVWSPENRTLCSCSGDKTLRLWDTQEGKEMSPPSPIIAHQFYVNCCAYSPAGDLLASGSSDATVKLWSTASWKLVCKEFCRLRICSLLSSKGISRVTIVVKKAVGKTLIHFPGHVVHAKGNMTF